MNGIINELVTELRNNPKIKNSAIVKIVIESINNSIQLGVQSDQILETALTNLQELGKQSVNENVLTEVVSKFKKIAQKPTQRLQNMAKEAGLEKQLKMLKESNIGKDPQFINTISNLEKQIAVNPEFRMLGVVYENLTKFSYDPQVLSILENLSKYVEQNRAKLEILNAIFEMRQSSPVIYKDAISILEESLLSDQTSADTVKMNLRGKIDLPITNSLINTLSMVEGKNNGKFNIGLGNGDTKVKSVISPFYKIDESNAIVFMDNIFIKLSADSEPLALSQNEALKYSDFYKLCESFSKLNFKERSNGIYTKGRNLEIAFIINESNELSLTINGNDIDDLTKINTSEIFALEQLNTRSDLVNIFNGLDMIVNVEFAKKLINEKLNADSIVFTINENQYVFEKLGESRIVKKLEGLDFHNYVLENFKYDVSELYSIQLSEQAEKLKQIEAEKGKINTDLEKLEQSILKLEEALSNETISIEYQTKLTDLKESIEQNIISLKNYYIELDNNKKKE